MASTRGDRYTEGFMVVIPRVNKWRLVAGHDGPMVYDEGSGGAGCWVKEKVAVGECCGL
jgi:hypothetical protein